MATDAGWRLRAPLGLCVLVVLLAFSLVHRVGASDEDPAGDPHAAAQTGQTDPGADHPDHNADRGDHDAGHADAAADHADAADHDTAGQDEEHGEDAHHPVPEVNPLWILPFVLLLGSIAVVPLINMHFWEHRYPWFAITLGLITGVYYMFFHSDLGASRSAWLHEMKEYVSFIALLGSLFIVSGGIVISVSRKATPLTNTVLLLIGGVIANVFGTTGAAMLLIRPFIRINKDHIKPYHIVFFIFIIANCGGSLTPIGDPPLFMGYLKGVPFFWVLQACWKMWAVCLGILLIMFFIIDNIDHAKAERAGQQEAARPIKIYGVHNFLFILIILVGVFQPSMFEFWGYGEYARIPISREILMLIAAIASKLSTKPHIYERNEFTYGPIREVAILFIGIFSTMVPALNYLNHNSDKMPLKSAGQYYFVTGGLSAVLDNAPTYLVFYETNQGQIQKEHGEAIALVRSAVDGYTGGGIPQVPAGAPPQVGPGVRALVDYNRKKIESGKVTDADVRIAVTIGNRDLEMYMIAISIGAVFFGACTYIGNGPNFMVKSIAESAGIQMPSFFGYVFKYSLPILIPVYVFVWYVFFVMGSG